MFRRIHAPIVFAAAPILASCSSAPERSMLGPNIATLGAAMPSITPLKDCNGTGGVKVRPCPVHLNRRTKSGIVVTVTGAGVVGSYLDQLNGCHNGRLCYNAERYGSSETKWLITPGRSCGSADVEFDAVNSSGGEVGYYFLKVANKYCP